MRASILFDDTTASVPVVITQSLLTRHSGVCEAVYLATKKTLRSDSTARSEAGEGLYTQYRTGYGTNTDTQTI
jgi:hypothetical protein